MTEVCDFRELNQRIGRDYLSRRLQRQVELAAKCYTRKGMTSFHPENSFLFSILLKYFLKSIGLYNKGRSNTIKYDFEHVRIAIPNLAEEFSGFRILQLSDLHADGLVDSGISLFSFLSKIECDLCVVTGDFRFLTYDNYDRALEITEFLLRAVQAPYGMWGILGNHDFVEFVPRLERAGLRMLLNESTQIEKDGARLCLAGVDDAHLYNCHDFERALQGKSGKQPCIVLSHTPEVYRQAKRAVVDYLICGHTHGGQICLPGGFSLITNSNCPKKITSGLWSCGRMQGYTSRGTGSSGLAVRFCCRPEVTLHQLSADKEGR